MPLLPKSLAFNFQYRTYDAANITLGGPNELIPSLAGSLFVVVFRQCGCRKDKCCYVPDFYWKRQVDDSNVRISDAPTKHGEPLLNFGGADYILEYIEFYPGNGAQVEAELGPLGDTEMLDNGHKLIHGIRTTSGLDWLKLSEFSSPNFKYKLNLPNRKCWCIPVGSGRRLPAFQGRFWLISPYDGSRREIYFNDFTGPIPKEVRCYKCNYKIVVWQNPDCPYRKRATDCCFDIYLINSGGAFGNGCIGGWRLLGSYRSGGSTKEVSGGDDAVLPHPIKTGLILQKVIPAGSTWTGVIVLYDVCGKEIERISIELKCPPSEYSTDKNPSNASMSINLSNVDHPQLILEANTRDVDQFDNLEKISSDISYLR